MSKTALTILADGFEEIEAVTAIDILRRAGIELTVAGLGSTEVRGAHDLLVRTDTELGQVEGLFDALVLPGGMPGTLHLVESPVVIRMVRQAFGEGRLCAAVCAAPRVFHEAGILEGKRFTCYPGAERHIRAGTRLDQAVVRDGNVITSKGVGTAIPFALEIVEYLLGREIAQELSEKIVFG